MSTSIFLDAVEGWIEHSRLLHGFTRRQRFSLSKPVPELRRRHDISVAKAAAITAGDCTMAEETSMPRLYMLTFSRPACASP